ncbi:hypothetical protein [Sphingobium sp. R-21]|uniref:hypothetical protein n=1 Tax=Sphingobium sp. R-21 TaxID=3404056 RepID=UPI003CE83B49
MEKIGYARAMFRSGPGVWGMALLEIIVVAGISLIPLTGAAIREVLPPESKIYLSDAFEKAFLSGQLLFYAVGLIATIVWHCNKDFKSFFPLRAIFNLYSLFGIVICSIVIGYDPTLSSTNKSFISSFSVAIFSVSIIIYVIMAVISEVHVNVGQALAKTDAQLGDAVRKSRGI